jgi:hypothetical protein
MGERVERRHAVETVWREREMGHVRVDEGGMRDMLPGQLDLSRGDVNAGEDKPFGELPRCWSPATTPQFQYVGIWWQVVEQDCGVLRAHIVGDLVGHPLRVPLRDPVIAFGHDAQRNPLALTHLSPCRQLNATRF